MKELTATSRKDKYRRGIEPNKKKFVDDMETLPTGSTGASSSSKRLPTLIYRPDSSISDYPSEYAGQSIGKTREFGGEARNLEGRGLNNRDAGLEACEQHVRHKDINQLRRQNQFLIERQAVLEGRLRKRPLPIRKVPVGIKDADGVTLRTRRVSMNPRDAASPSTLDNEERTPPLPPGASHTTNTDDVLSMAPEDKAHITDPSFFRVPPPQSLQTLRTNPKRVSKTQEGTNGTNRNVF
ncbi:hypothetical protein CC78DRAFT_69 [Lojkania enalia]|uniref:Uncharacterized protein n=1 Tax=Lojkania enalia TaxID=147567 RepID=A0A9P4NCK5_9PLEO|nr:hypothetical protein CC78DRAFT_69 [Didymosphaeria enalia]